MEAKEGMTNLQRLKRHYASNLQTRNLLSIEAYIDHVFEFYAERTRRAKWTWETSARWCESFNRLSSLQTQGPSRIFVSYAIESTRIAFFIASFVKQIAFRNEIDTTRQLSPRPRFFRSSCYIIITSFPKTRVNVRITIFSLFSILDSQPKIIHRSQKTDLQVLVSPVPVMQV